MKTIFESRNGKVVRNNVGYTVETRGGEQLLIRDMAAELERLQAAKLRGACRRIAALCQFPESEARDAIAEAAP